MDDDDLPLSSLRRKKAKPREKTKGFSPQRTPSLPRRNTNRAVLNAYSLDAGLLGDVRFIHEFVSEHRTDALMKIGFAVLGRTYPVLIEKQSQLDALPPGVHDAQIIYAHPTQAQLQALDRRRRTVSVAKASRLKS